jgi:N-methylhydantoinase B
VLTQGGGGLGDAAERDPAALAHDVLTGKVSPEAARTVYARHGMSSST